MSLIHLPVTCHPLVISLNSAGKEMQRPPHCKSCRWRPGEWLFFFERQAMAYLGHRIQQIEEWIDESINKHIYIYLFIYIHIYIYIYSSISYIHVCIYTYIYIFVFTYVCNDICRCVGMHVHIFSSPRPNLYFLLYPAFWSYFPWCCVWSTCRPAAGNLKLLLGWRESKN